MTDKILSKAGLAAFAATVFLGWIGVPALIAFAVGGVVFAKVAAALSDRGDPS